MAHSAPVSVGILGAILAGVLQTAQAAPASALGLTCDPADLAPGSYRLTTRGVAAVVNEERTDWWTNGDLGRVQDDLSDLNLGVARAAERALELDPRNLMAHSLLARQALIDLDGDTAEAAWAQVFAAGGAVAWTGTLYDVDARNYFLLAFDQRGIRIYRFEQVARRVERSFFGVIRFPPSDDARFWAAAGGCIESEVVPEAEVAWANVREIKAGNYVLWFKLTRPVAVISDRNGKRKTLDEIKVALHGAMPSWEVYKPVGEAYPAIRGRGPAGFQDLVRRTLVRFVDPERRIALPPLKPGVGW
jgi:hypothetical protein